jgi:hypothetical protein
MASRGRIFLPNFDRAADFVVARQFQFAGAPQVTGEPFDKTQCSDRKLRLLYDARKIKMINGTGTPRRSSLAALTAADVGARASLEAHLAREREKKPAVVGGMTRKTNGGDPDPVASLPPGTIAGATSMTIQERELPPAPPPAPVPPPPEPARVPALEPDDGADSVDEPPVVHQPIKQPEPRHKRRRRRGG